ncbi:hypothetical protein [Actinomycetospora cinnamomea]|uniref:Uncharacterized protein n=1 Tax=Actinomycetospora cinnamomea TaxID=663609 RepID=A0A2U1EDE8_9PSEU|nr:hypothetical protein [Actinomycetospora cinnamomea]PVY97993.1 hypothetical protein C8D89_12248 [Actinomycetospora cinnamomea]
MTSTRYELRILGRLSPEVRADFSGFDVSEAPVETVLLGHVVDTAHLQGVLARLQAFGLQVLELRTLPESSQEALLGSGPEGSGPSW